MTDNCVLFNRCTLYNSESDIAHNFTEVVLVISTGSVVLVCHQSDCGWKEAVKEVSSVGYDTVRSAVYQVIAVGRLSNLVACVFNTSIYNCVQLNLIESVIELSLNVILACPLTNISPVCSYQ